jgi:hypothetical protein
MLDVRLQQKESSSFGGLLFTRPIVERWSILLDLKLARLRRFAPAGQGGRLPDPLRHLRLVEVD